MDADHKTPVLDTVEDLRELLQPMREHAGKIGRTDPIDVVISSGLLPPHAGFDAQADSLRDAEPDVTGITAGGLGRSPQEAEEFIQRYGEEVIPRLKS